MAAMLDFTMGAFTIWLGLTTDRQLEVHAGSPVWLCPIVTNMHGI
jgi:hypothetical protein